MSSPIFVKAAALGALAGIAALAAGSGACSSSSGGFGGDNNNNPNAEAGKPDTSTGDGPSSSPCSTAIQCPSPSSAVSVLFSPMYSAYVTDDPGAHQFQVPAIVKGISASDANSVTWGVSDPTAVSCSTDTMTGGIMITVQKAGAVTIVAQTSAGCGQSVLNVTPATQAQWQTGNARFNSSVPVYGGCIGLGGKKDYPDGGASACPTVGPGCVQCHGAVPKNMYFQSVPNTPEQAGGFSDQELIGIFTNGMVPAGGYYDTSIISPLAFSVFHRWRDIQGSDQQAMVTYLRSLTPIPEGPGNFGGGGSSDDGGSGTTDATVEPTSPTCGAMKCATGEVCCVAPADKTDAGLIGACGAASSCTGYALSCSITADCPSGQVCCGDLGGTPATATCQTSCSSTDDQLCGTVAECPSGDACRGYPYGDGIKVCVEKTGDGGKGGKKDGG
jgi:hypothetical protein